ncbi:MAG TPA: hypothetical protein VGO48_04235 [Conexibacter sp.]|jgi:hypothetical protein|nr:hypothetical protein [Conexibacter sp.]
MAGAWGTPRRRSSALATAQPGAGRALAPGFAAGVLIAGSLAIAALTLLAPSSPSYDPFAWIVWGRELMPGAGGEPFGLSGGPSWKPLPVLFTAPFSLAGDAAPALWLLVARTGLLLALAGAFALGRRLGGIVAGVVAAIAVLLLADVVSLAWRGASEPLLLATLLWAFERELAGRRTLAFGLGVAAALIRPELLLFLAIYALWRWPAAAARERVALTVGLASVVVLWIGVPALAGDPFAASSTAHNPSTRTSAWSALRGDLGLTLAIVWALACVGVALRPRAPAVRALALSAIAWLTLLAVMAAAGYASPARYGLPAAACAAVLAGVGVAALAQRRQRLAAGIVLAVCAGFAAQQLTELPDQVREGTAVAHAHDDLRAAVARSGGAAAMQRCALAGWVAVNHTTGSALVWELHVSLDRVARTMSRPGLLVRAPRSTATGGPPAVTLDAPVHSAPVAHAGPWEVLAVRSAGRLFPHACERRKASGSPRRIPNI